MPSDPPPPSNDSPLPARHRPTLENLSQDTTEADLWDFEDDLDLEGETAHLAPRPAGRDIPTPRERVRKDPLAPEQAAAPKPPDAGEKIRINVNRPRPKKSISGSGPLAAEPEFDDLENWDDPEVTPEIEDLPAEVPIAADQAAGPEVAAAEPEDTMHPETPPAPDGDDEFSPIPREGSVPVSLRPHLMLSKVERIGLVALVVLLMGGGATVFLMSLGRLPTESIKAAATDFPIKGDRVTVTSATSYWRAPVTEGPNPDTFRRGTELLPVLELAVSGGPAGVRVLFRSEDLTVIGDAVTRRVDGTGRLVVPATAGFDDPGMHAAYRTGESDPWTIEVYEINPEDPSGKDLKRLFEMNISTDRR